MKEYTINSQQVSVFFIFFIIVMMEGDKCDSIPACTYVCMYVCIYVVCWICFVCFVCLFVGVFKCGWTFVYGSYVLDAYGYVLEQFYVSSFLENFQSIDDDVIPSNVHFCSLHV